MIVDGKKIAKDILLSLKEDVESLGEKPRLAVITCAPNFETKKFLEIKKKKAEEIGVVLVVTELSFDSKTEDGVQAILREAQTSDGIIVQLPFPGHIDQEVLLDAIPSTHDVDAFMLHDAEVLSPVVGALHEILKLHAVTIKEAKVVVVGNGRLVGAPSAKWFKDMHARVEILTKDTEDLKVHTVNADIVVLGAGKPHILKKSMVREGVVILDAGTSEEGGELQGDADPRCAQKASLFTPVPGGIGPITIAILLRNLVILTSRKRNHMV